MAVERFGGGSLVEVLDRVLDKGVVIDAFVSVSLVGFEILSVQARVIVSSVQTYLQYAEAIGQIQPAARPMLAIDAPPPALKALAAENVALQAEWANAGQAAEPARARSR
jgi:gas vesicle structural protein